MNTLAKKWVAALRSGKYLQGQGRLLRSGTYCCLGVLCDIAPSKYGLAMTDGRDGFTDGQGSDSTFHPPGDLFEATGLDNMAHLINLNDNDRVGFDQIADYIESELVKS